MATRREEYVQEHWNNYKKLREKYSKDLSAGISMILEGERQKSDPNVLWRTGVDRVISGGKIRDEARRELANAELAFQEAVRSAYGPEIGIIFWINNKSEVEVAGITYQ